MQESAVMRRTCPLASAFAPGGRHLEELRHRRVVHPLGDDDGHAPHLFWDSAVAGPFFGPSGWGMVMSSFVTCPKEDSGRSNSDGFPTTRTANWSGWMYFFATRATSSRVTFSMPARYL